MNGYAQLDAMIAAVKALGELPERVAAEAAPAVQAVLRKTAAAGTSPDGVPWAATKEGKPALKNAAAAIHVTAKGPVITARLEGTSTGSAKVQAVQNHTRPILPVRGDDLPKSVANAVTQAAERVFRRTVGA
jgi:hypothetical protein